MSIEERVKAIQDSNLNSELKKMRIEALLEDTVYKKRTVDNIQNLYNRVLSAEESKGYTNYCHLAYRVIGDRVIVTKSDGTISNLKLRMTNTGRAFFYLKGRKYFLMEESNNV